MICEDCNVEMIARPSADKEEEIDGTNVIMNAYVCNICGHWEYKREDED